MKANALQEINYKKKLFKSNMNRTKYKFMTDITYNRVKKKSLISLFCFNFSKQTFFSCSVFETNDSNNQKCVLGAEGGFKIFQVIFSAINLATIVIFFYLKISFDLLWSDKNKLI